LTVSLLVARAILAAEKLAICLHLKSIRFNNEEVKNMRQRYVCVFVILGVLHITCSQPNKFEEAKSTGIIGYWNWLESMGVESRIRATPDSVGYTQTFRFDPDSIFCHYRNDTVTVSGHYWITFEPWHLPGTDSVMVLRTDKWTPFGSQWWVFFNAPDTLVLADLAFDAAEHKFVRGKSRCRL